MKKFNYFLVSVLALSTFLFTSCDNGEDEEEPNGPGVEFIAESGFEVGSKTVEPGTVVKYKINITKGDKNIDRLEVLEDGNNFSVTKDRLSFDGVKATENPIDVDAGNVEVWITADVAGTTHEYSMVVTDKDGVSTTKTVTITSKTLSPISTYEVVLLGAQKAAAGSYFASSNGQVYASSEFNANKDKIDFSFAEIGATNNLQPKLIAIDFRGDEDLTTNLDGRKCYFKASSMDFDNASKADIDGIMQSDKQSIVIELDKVYEFVTEDGRKGLIKVTKLENLNSDFKAQVTIDVKVQNPNTVILI